MPVLYVMQAIPATLVREVATLLYKDLGIPNARIALWVRKDGFVPLKWVMYDKAGVLFKTLVARETRLVNGRWFISKSTMTNHVEGHSTDLDLQRIVGRDDIPDDEFTVRNLEKT